MKWHTHVHLCKCGNHITQFTVYFLEQGMGLLILFEATCKCGSDVVETCNMDEIAKNCYVADAQENLSFIPCNGTIQ